MQKSEIIKRYYTKELDKISSKTVYDLFTWTKRDVLLKDYKTGKTLLSLKDVKFPDFYSQNAVDIIASKYFKRAGVPGTGHETDLSQVVDRMVDYWVSALSDEGLLKTEEEKDIFYDEAAYIIISQRFAPNSPQWFNTGVGKTYGVKGSQSELYHYYPEHKEVRMCEHDYEFAQISACFILSIQDSLIGPHSISETYETETKLFKGGSGTGSNFSNLRAKGEALSGGGESSGVMSFLDGFDKNAGAIKSGGTCLAPWSLVKTEKGNIRVDELAKSKERFITLSYNPILGRVQANEAIAFESGKKELYRLTTDKGVFTMSLDHPVALMDGRYVEVRDLKPGMSLRPLTITLDSVGHEIIGLHDGKKGKEKFHRLIVTDVLGQDLDDGKVVHHIDGNPKNNDINNLSILKNQSEHAAIHGKEDYALGIHPFNKYAGKKREDISGDKNGMSHASGNRTEEWKKNWTEGMKRENVWSTAQDYAATQKMLNTAYKVINLGGNIDTFENYYKSRTKLIGKIASKSGLLKKIESRFGSYELFYDQIRTNNHAVVSVESLGYDSVVYDVTVFNNTPGDRSALDGHNFPIMSETVDTTRNGGETGIFVHNTRRSAKMVSLDIDHPEIEEFITWKSREEDKALALMKMGYDGDMNGEAYATVSGQNSNNSVRITDEFMKLVERLDKNPDAKFTLTGRKDSSVNKQVLVKDLWEKFNQSSWRCADPAPQFVDTFNAWHTCPAGEDNQPFAPHNKLNSTNP